MSNMSVYKANKSISKKDFYLLNHKECDSNNLDDNIKKIGKLSSTASDFLNNSSVNEDNDIDISKYVKINMSISTEDGLIVIK